MMLEILYSEEFLLTAASTLPRDVVWIDIETRKVPVDDPSWGYKTRWQPFMVSVAGAMDPGIFFVDVVAGDEADVIAWLEENFEGRVVRYAGTREFDEMVLRGRFTNARRAHSPVAGPWPNLDKADLRWTNIRKVIREAGRPIYREADCPSREVPALWAKGERELVTLHCLRDVVEMALADPSATFGPALDNALSAILRND